jgi:large repetitive protein
VMTHWEHRGSEVRLAGIGAVDLLLDDVRGGAPIPVPAISSVQPSQGVIGGGSEVRIFGEFIEPGATVFFDGVPAHSSTLVEPTQVLAVSPPHDYGWVDVTVTNANGYSGTLAMGYKFVFPPPSLATLSPEAGTTGGGTEINITGHSFRPGQRVLFGSSEASSAILSDTAISATSPPNPPGVVDVTVMDEDGQFSTSSDAYEYIAPVPTVSSITPEAAASGAAVTVIGTNFSYATQVTIGDLPVDFSVVDDSSLSIEVSPDAVTGPLSVTTSGGTGTSSFALAVQPTIEGFHPASATAATYVTINGTAFSSVQDVRFNDVAASSYSVISNRQIGAVLPPTTTTGPISVITLAGEAMSGTDLLAAPTLSGFTPVRGSVGTEVVIHGQNLRDATGVAFSGVPAQSFTATDLTATAVAPDGATSGPIRVETNGGVATTTDSFIILPSGDANGDGEVTVADVFFAINYFFLSGPASEILFDPNGDGIESAADIFYLISHLFANGPAPI